MVCDAKQIGGGGGDFVDSWTHGRAIMGITTTNNLEHRLSSFLSNLSQHIGGTRSAAFRAWMNDNNKMTTASVVVK